MSLREVPLYHAMQCLLLLNTPPPPCIYACSTPLIKLGSLSEQTGCTIAVKAEQLNPGGSVKDRAALYLLKDAEKRGVCVHVQGLW